MPKRVRIFRSTMQVLSKEWEQIRTNLGQAYCAVYLRPNSSPRVPFETIRIESVTDKNLWAQTLCSDFVRNWRIWTCRQPTMSGHCNLVRNWRIWSCRQLTMWAQDKCWGKVLYKRNWVMNQSGNITGFWNEVQQGQFSKCTLLSLSLSLEQKGTQSLQDHVAIDRYKTLSTAVKVYFSCYEQKKTIYI